MNTDLDPTKPTNPQAAAWRSFCTNTTNHELTVIRDETATDPDAPYRHLRMAEPGTRMWSWDIICWPGHLATSGDIADGYVFSRLRDMMQFFATTSDRQNYYSDGAPSLDLRYWAEKLCGGRSHEVQVYSKEQFLTQVTQALAEQLVDGDIGQDDHDLLLEQAGEHSDTQEQAHRWLRDNEQVFGTDTWEWDLRDWDFHFVLACYAINHSVLAYLEQR